MRAVLTLLLSLSAASGAAQSVMDRSDAGIDRALVLAAFRSLSENSTDPYSFQLDRLQASKAEDGSPSLCGYVNQLNLYGKYGGFMPFAYTLADNSSAAVITGEVTPGMMDIYRRIFERAGCEHLLPRASSSPAKPVRVPLAAERPPPKASKNLVAALTALNSRPYDRTAAGYVTSSKDAAVLDYIVCLQAATSSMPGSDLPSKLNAAAFACSSKATNFGAGEPGAWQIGQMVLECGFRPGDASPGRGC